MISANDTTTHLLNPILYGTTYISATIYPWDQGGIQGSDLGVFRPKHTIPIRARAYNDCVKTPILLKTRSSGGIPDPLIERVLGLQIGTHVW